MTRIGIIRATNIYEVHTSCYAQFSVLATSLLCGSYYDARFVAGGTVAQITQITDLGSHHWQVVESDVDPGGLNSESELLITSPWDHPLKILFSNSHSF